MFSQKSQQRLFSHSCSFSRSSLDNVFFNLWQWCQSKPQFFYYIDFWKIISPAQNSRAKCCIEKPTSSPPGSVSSSLSVCEKCELSTLCTNIWRACRAHSKPLFPNLTKYEEAIDCYNKVIEINPNDQIATKNLKEVIILKKKKIEA